MPSVRQPRRRGLKAVELILVVVLGLAALGILVTAIPRMRESANRLQCADHLKKIGEAVHLFQQNKGFLPASRIDRAYATWAVQIAPYLPLGSEPALQDWDLQKTDYAQPEKVRQFQVRLYYCPSRRRPPQNSIAGDVPQDGRPDREHYPGALGDYACSAGGGSVDPWDGDRANGAII